MFLAMFCLMEKKLIMMNSKLIAVENENVSDFLKIRNFLLM